MKKIIIFVICGILILSVLVSCGKKQSDNIEPVNKADSANVDVDIDTDIEKKKATLQKETSGIGYGPGSAGEYYYSTYVLKDIETELRIPECPDIQDGDELHLLECRTESTASKLKEQYEEFAKYLDFEHKDSIVTEESDSVYQMSFPTGRGIVTGTYDDRLNGSAITIRSMPHRLTVGYQCSDEICENRANIDAVSEYLLEEPAIKAVCAYEGIENPVFYQRMNYDIYGSPSTEYFIYDESDDQYTAAKKFVFLAIFEHKTILIMLNPHDPFESDELCPAIGVETAVDIFCDKNNLDRENIYKIGFAYFDVLNTNYCIPCYAIICRGDNEFAKMNDMDLSVYQEWDLFLVPAIDFPVMYAK